MPMSKWVAGVFCGLCSLSAATVWPALGHAHHTQLRAAAITDPAELARRREPVVNFQGGAVTIGVEPVAAGGGGVNCAWAAPAARARAAARAELRGEGFRLILKSGFA